MDIKEAYGRLGLGETTTQEELDRGFDLLLKREKTARTNGDSEALAGLELDIEAYRTIFDYRAKREVDQAEEQRLRKFGKLSGTVSRSEDFFRINRTKIFAAIGILAGLIIIGSIVGNIIQQRRYEASLPPVDLNIMFLGNMQANDQEQESKTVQQAILDQFPDWKRVKVRILFQPPAGSDAGGLGAANQQKAMAELVADYPDILVLDKETLNWMSGQDSLADLTDPVFAKIYETAKKKGTVVNGKDPNSGEEHAYGIDFTNTEFAKALPMAHGGDLVVASNPQKKGDAKIMEFLEKCAGVTP
ncbi:hypothetical protein [Gorillibacterium sp. sgz500922]|uniref:hypothetical protein n=1 Tax=Gorillibacterium sp. sgz500922 TaxID=3446694 RepID=UPI003F670FA7